MHRSTLLVLLTEAIRATAGALAQTDGALAPPVTVLVASVGCQVPALAPVPGYT